MAYVSQQMKKELAPEIKRICAKYGMKGTLSVDHHSELVLTLKSGKIDFGGAQNVNVYWYQEHFTGKALDFLSEVIDALKGPNYFDHSDSMSDYFHCSHYYSVNIGRWNNPYILENG